MNLEMRLYVFTTESQMRSAILGPYKSHIDYGIHLTSSTDRGIGTITPFLIVSLLLVQQSPVNNVGNQKPIRNVTCYYGCMQMSLMAQSQIADRTLAHILHPIVNWW